MQSKEVQEKSKLTNLKNCGYEYPMQSKEVQEKSRNTKFNKFGDENYNNRYKYRVTNLKNSGFENPMQTGLFSFGYKYKDYIYPSGKIVKVQGYENQLLDELLETYTESEILTDRIDMPEFWYKTKEGKNHRYFPDVYIPKTNTIYEVKSDYTLNESKKNGIYDLKAQSVLDSRFNFILKVF